MPENKVPRAGFIIPGTSPLNVGVHGLPIQKVGLDAAAGRDALACERACFGIVVDVEGTLYIRRRIRGHRLNPFFDTAA